MLQRGASQKTCLDLKHGSLRPQRKIGHCSAVAVYFSQEDNMKRNLKLVSLLLVLVLALGVILSGCGAKDTDPASSVFVTVSNAAALGTTKDGNFAAAIAVEVPAAGSTVKEVITALHKNYCKEGEAGFATATSEYGETIAKLWGVENGGSYLYYVNGAMANALTDPVKAGDTIDLVIMKDAAGFSDKYFDLKAAVDGTKVTVTATSHSFDANWNPVDKPLEGVKIYRVDGKKLVDTGAVTGADGTATLTLKAGIYRLAGEYTAELYSMTAVKVVTK